MRLAIVTDWLTTPGGAERAIGEFHALWPESPIFTTVHRSGGIPWLDKATIRTSRLQALYRMVKRHQVLLPLMPGAVESLDLSGFDAILSSSHAVAKGIIPPAGSVHVCYCHTPMRYAWEMEKEYVGGLSMPTWLKNVIHRQLRRLRRWDLSTAKRVDMFIANSNETAARIERIYGRSSVVIPPPVQDRFFSIPLVPRSQRKGYLCVGRLVPYKRFDLAVMAATEGNLPLTIVGTGQEMERLKAMAGPTVTFRGRVDDDALPSLYANAKAILFPTHEDAGLVPVEAQACGTPVVAFGRGGALDTVVKGSTGVFFETQSPEFLRVAIDTLDSSDWSPESIRSHAEQFSSLHFRERIAATVNAEYDRLHAERSAIAQR